MSTTTTTTKPVYRRFFSEQPGQAGTRKVNQSRFKWDKRLWGLGTRWHQLNHMQTICTSPQTDNHTNTSSLNFYRPDALFLTPNQLCQSTEGKALRAKRNMSSKCIKLHTEYLVFCAHKNRRNSVPRCPFCNEFECYPVHCVLCFFNPSTSHAYFGQLCMFTRKTHKQKNADKTLWDFEH